ncbi:hypothetical protein [Pseudomonas sp. BE134]|jgi:hypothetical protein|uniref:hypothetical protein n=1 Tax=Pseudomonas sp. BE134 TaxID=2817843 RepID=UPI00285A1852|nr:hypothetical protein [Pseudomonas sp. BE134]MDR6925005.1 hypothetical protein [Pseudomonas sp. BE134]
MKSISVLVCAIMVSASALAFEGSPDRNNPPGVIQTESGKGVNMYYMGDGFGYANPLTISAGNPSFNVGTLVHIQNRGGEPTTVNATNTSLGAPLKLPGKSGVVFKFDGKTWVSQGVVLSGADLPDGALPSGQQNVAPASAQ